ncbi:hypothetical protein PoB_002754700 [Plakobranchus ocellatus]|uniref:SMB domain-containing protein n=1 Tax=Plakobranchus ocellatus TaxID=259542 RepID=A0AAV4A172_9GAST|nr:hypothetical protein PoB_002754700 [Plakobranchus ocellatus]
MSSKLQIVRGKQPSNHKVESSSADHRLDNSIHNLNDFEVDNEASVVLEQLDGECLNMTSMFLYDKEMFEASKTEIHRHPKSAIARYTSCINRCGSSPAYHGIGAGLQECACDQSCITHADCCDDIESVCSDIYTAGKSVYSHLRDTDSRCIDDSFRVLTHQDSIGITRTSTPATLKADTVGNSNASQLLQSCDVVDTRDVITQFHRPCPTNNILLCRSREGQVYRGSSREACNEQNISELEGQTLNLGVFTSIAAENRHKPKDAPDEKCLFLPGASPVPYHDPPTDAVLMSITPVFSPPNIHERNDTGLGIKIKNTSSLPRCCNNVELRNELTYIVELTNTLERRYRCASLSSVFSDCELQECQDYAILSRRTCIIPDVVRVYQSNNINAVVPLCTCMRLLAALQNLRVWIVRREKHEKNKCHLTLERKPLSKLDLCYILLSKILSMFMFNKS